MVERVDAADTRWAAVDALVAPIVAESAAQRAVLCANAAAGLPDIDVSPAQGKLLALIARVSGAARVLEVGTLGGYSTLWLAQAGAHVTTLELDPHHARIAEENTARHGLSERVKVIVGAAAETLATLAGPFDLVFIDADKQGNVDYVREAIRLSRPGTVIIVDNVVREGLVLDAASPDPRVQGTRALYDYVAREPRLSATVIQTVGLKKWDGFLLAVVD